MIFTKELNMPSWVKEFLRSQADTFPSVESRMKLAIDLARMNVEHKSGGPFGACIFERDSGKLVAIGVNQVIPSHCSIAHAEMMAIALAQEALGTFSLGAPGLPAHELVTSAQMCAMCFGALPWSGIKRVIMAATAEDTEELTGFDEGPIHPNWREELERRGISIMEEVLRKEGRAVLQLYRDTGGYIYNASELKKL